MKLFVSILFFLNAVCNFAQSTWAPISFEVVSNTCTQNNNAEIYISEIYDSNGDTYGVIELYNPTNNPVNLANYKMNRRGDYGTGNWSWNGNNGIQLSGTIQPNSTFLIIIPGSQNNCPITGITPQGISGINEKDQIVLIKSGVQIDEVECPDVPGSGQAGFVIRRKPEAIAPKPIRDVNDWIITLFPTSSSHDCSNLGTHTPILPITVTNVEQRTDGDYDICRIPARVRVTFSGGSGQYDANANTLLNFWVQNISSPWATQSYPNTGDHTILIRDRNNHSCVVTIKFHLDHVATSEITTF